MKNCYLNSKHHGGLNMNDPVDKKKKPQKFMPNNQYFTISIYVLVVVAISALIIRVVMTPYAVSNALKHVLNVIMPFLIGIFIALLLHPLIMRLYKLLNGPCKLKSKVACKAISIIVAYLLVLGVLAICVGYIIPQIVVSITDIVNLLPKLYNSLSDFFENLQQRFPNSDLSALQNTANDFFPEAINSLRNFASDMVPAIYNASVSFIKMTLNILIAIIVSVYMIIDKTELIASMKRLVYAFAPEGFIDVTLEIFSECNHIFSNFIAGKALDSLIIGILCFILMSIFRMPYTLLISVIVGVTNMIPYFGPFIGAVPGALIVLMVSFWQAVGFVIMIFLLQQFDGLYLGPKILGNSIGIKPLWIIISITIGGSIGGVLGMFLGVPIFAMLSYILELLIHHQLKKRQISPKEE